MPRCTAPGAGDGPTKLGAKVEGTVILLEDEYLNEAVLETTTCA